MHHCKIVALVSNPGVSPPVLEPPAAACRPAPVPASAPLPPVAKLMTLPRALVSRALAGSLFSILAVASMPAAAATPAAPFKPDLARGQAVAAVCMACHTADGSRGATANPILAGQHPEYIVKQLKEYKSGVRKNAVMQGMAAALSEDDMRHVAAFYAGKAKPPGVARTADGVELGRDIWRGGIAGRLVPACAGCHGPTGAGIPAQYPRIAAQHAEYTESTLLAFRSGQRANNASMMTIAGKMTDREIKAVADFAAGLR
jgi:cytochrome c553